MRYNARSPIARMPTIIHVREPPRPRRNEWSVMRRSAPRYTSDPPDLEDRLASLPAPPAEPIGRDDRRDRDRHGDNGHRELHVADAAVDLAPQLAQLGLDVVAGDLLGNGGGGLAHEVLTEVVVVDVDVSVELEV